MAALQCDICGGKLTGKPGGIFECDSCGMEYSTEWAKAKIQEIKGTVKVEGTVEVSGTVKVEGSASAENLLLRGQMALEDRKWEEAKSYFSKVLDSDTQNAQAYLGLVMAEKKISHTRNIERYLKDGPGYLLVSDNNYQRSERFADAELKKQFDRWNQVVKEIRERREAERLAQEQKELEEELRQQEQARKLEQQMQKSLQQQRFQRLIATSFGHTVALKADGTLLTTGDNKYGQRNVEKFKDIVGVYAGEGHTIGLRSDGTVVATAYQGDPEYYRDRCEVGNWKNIRSVTAFSNGNFGICEDGSVVVAGKPYFSNEKAYPGAAWWRNIVAVAVGSFDAIGLVKDGTVRIITEAGRKAKEELANGIHSWKEIVAICANTNTFVGLRADGTVVAVGENDFGQCDVGHWKDIVAIAAGAAHVVGLRADGTVVASGSNGAGRCDVSGWRNVVAVAAYNAHTVGLCADGTVVATGDNSSGQCDVQGWKLFENADTFEEEAAVAKKAAAEKKQRRIRELCEERDTLQTEMASIKGLFAGIKRWKYEDRLAEIESELKGL